MVLRRTMCAIIYSEFINIQVGRSEPPVIVGKISIIVPIQIESRIPSRESIASFSEALTWRKIGQYKVVPNRTSLF